MTWNFMIILNQEIALCSLKFVWLFSSVVLIILLFYLGLWNVQARECKTRGCDHWGCLHLCFSWAEPLKHDTSCSCDLSMCDLEILPLPIGHDLGILHSLTGDWSKVYPPETSAHLSFFFCWWEYIFLCLIIAEKTSSIISPCSTMRYSFFIFT